MYLNQGEYLAIKLSYGLLTRNEGDRIDVVVLANYTIHCDLM